MDYIIYSITVLPVRFGRALVSKWMIAPDNGKGSKGIRRAACRVRPDATQLCPHLSIEPD
jgi:hypothetical protein